jgi:hypothetical protein
MKQLVLVGALMGALSVGTAYAQEKGAKPDSGGQGHTAEHAVNTAPSPTAPAGSWLGSVSLPPVKPTETAPAGTYQ